jgi:hypothetical protein
MIHEAMISLDAEHRFAGGYHRDCYIHPADDSLCIKVSLRGNFRESTREAKYYRHLQRRHVPWELLPRFHGFVETNLGSGAVFDLVRDFDGKVSATLEHYLGSPALKAANVDGLIRAIQALKAHLIEYRIITRTLKAKNIVYQKSDPGNGRLVIIDNIGNTEFFPIGNYVGFLARRKITRKWARFERDVLKEFEDSDFAGSNPMKSDAAGLGGCGEAAMVDLDHAQWIGRGWKRDCFLHPTDPGLCIKVASDDAAGKLRERIASWYHAESTGDAHNRREWQAYHAFGTILAPFVPRYHGFIATSRGPGLVVDLVRDGDGAPSVPLRDWLHQGTPDRGAALLDQLHILFDLLTAHDLWLMDLNLQNFLVQVAADGTERPWLVDLKRLADNKEIFQVSGWSTTLKRRKLARRIDQFNAKFKARLGT